MEHSPHPHDDVAPNNSLRSNGESSSTSSSTSSSFVFQTSRRRNVPSNSSSRRPSPRPRDKPLLPSHSSLSDEVLSVTNVRRVYSSLLKELAPRHFGTADGTTHRRGMISVTGSDDEGYDYVYALDGEGGARRTLFWRRWGKRGGEEKGGESGEGATTTTDSNDGIRRYYTGGVIAVGHDEEVEGRVGGGEKASRTILSLGSLDVDVGSMDGVRIDVDVQNAKSKSNEEGNVQTTEVTVVSNESATTTADEHKHDDSNTVAVDIDMALSSSSLEDIELNSPSHHHPHHSAQAPPSPPPDTAESLPRFTPTLAWRLRAAHAPTTPRERHWDAVGSDLAVLARRDSRKAEELRRLGEAAAATEERVCDGLKTLGRLVCRSERLMAVGTDDDADDPESREAAEAVFAYFCEKNVLPLLVDSFACRPPPWTSDRSVQVERDDSSPFSGVAWTVAAKAQILQTLSMLIGNAVSPLSLTYLLSNNYVNELIAGMLPLTQWKDDALEDLLPPFVTLLRGLVLTLRRDDGPNRNCAPLLLCRRPAKNDRTHRAETETYMPLFHAAVHVLVSPLGSSLRDVDGSLVRTTAMNAVLNLCRVTDPDVRSILIGTVEQHLLFSSVCRNLQSCHGRSVRLIMASLSLNDKHRRSKRHCATRHPNPSPSSSSSSSSPATDEARSRHTDVAESLLAEVRHWWGFVDDLLSCSVRVLNVRLCEILVREVIVHTVLRSWHRSSMKGASPPSSQSGDSDHHARRERYRSIAETRASLWFLAQFFGMVEYPPLVRMVATAVLHPHHPKSWCEDTSRGGTAASKSTSKSNEEFFVVTPALNALVAGGKRGVGSSFHRGSRRVDVNGDGEEKKRRNAGQEADAGAGEGGTTRASSNSSTPTTIADGHADEAPRAAMGNGDTEDDDDDDPTPADNSTTEADRTSSEEFASNPIRSGLQTMLAGNASIEDSILASMLLATILENDAVDGHVLETLHVFSAFVTSLAAYLQRDLAEVHEADVHPPSLHALARGMESCSLVGMMLVERILHHRLSSRDITELRDSKQPPFDVYDSPVSEWIAALESSLSYFAAYSRTLSRSKIVGNLFAEFAEMEIRRRYSQDAEETHLHPDHHDDMAWVCHLPNFFPSNLMDDAKSLIIDGGEDNHPSVGSSNEIEAAKFAIRITLHLRCLKKCIEEFRERSSSYVDPRSNLWHDLDDCLSFRTTQTADDAILLIGGIPTTRLPRVGTDIDLRGRTFFRGSLPTKKTSPRLTSFRKGANANVVADLAIVIDPSEVYVTRSKRGEPNRCTVLTAVPLRTVIASATEGALLHVAVRRQENVAETQHENTIVKDGKMTLRFESSANSLVVKECLDKYCSAYRSRIASEIDDMLEKLISNEFRVSGGNQPQSPDPENEEC